MNRREFLLKGSGRSARRVELSGERLYMKYVDAKLESRTGEFLEALRKDLRSVDSVHLRDAFWLEPDELKEEFNRILDDFRSRGGIVDYL